MGVTRDAIETSAGLDKRGRPYRLRRRIDNAFLCSRVMFHGRNIEISQGARPPAAAQASKNHISHRRGFSSHRSSVAKIEKSIAAKRPLHSDAEP